jgi:hypothetical protein
MSKTIIAVDIGKKGAICVIHKDGSVSLDPMPMVSDEVDYHNLWMHLAMEKNKNLAVNDVTVIFEKLGVIFGTSKTTAFSMGHQAGALEGMCVALGMSYYKITAKVWQKEMFQGTVLVTKKSKSGKSVVTDTKATALIVVKQLFPNEKLTFGDRATKPHDGLIDARLMAEYARRKNL